MGSIEQLQALILSGIDTHIHVGDPYHKDGGLNRMWTVSEADNLGLPVVAKAHFFSFIPEAPNVYGSVTLNTGLDPEAIRRVSKEMTKQFTVWFPSLNARAHHNAVAGDAAWKTLFAGIEIGEPISVIDESGKLTMQAIETIDAIRQAGAILATGHLSSNEVNVLVPEAISMGVRSVILTHVSSRHNRILAEDQKRLIDLGDQAGAPVYAEHCAITWIDGKEGAYNLVRDFVTPIQTVGAEHCILSSDCGRVLPADSTNPATPIESLMTFSELLIEKGLSLSDLQQMLVTNPKRLLQSNDS